MKTDKSGFTLIEIVIVVAIVGLLATLGSLGYTKAMHNSRVNVAQSELEMIAAATLQLAWDTGKWPNGAWRNQAASGNNEVSDLSDGPLFSISDADLYPGWQGPYYEGSLVDPWGQSYYFDSDYRVDGENRIVVGSGGPNCSRINRYDSDNIYVFLDD
ncbi:prepilin-type N-terminal cleavage/methylation domain-containing protein [Pontiella sp.]|uniref:prepilin-type N-terminal cleavage/methylation domain-containing protein n=1 Tax=Pontiella sp. TaxID=2837462 RepID=UPI003567106F